MKQLGTWILRSVIVKSLIKYYYCYIIFFPSLSQRCLTPASSHLQDHCLSIVFNLSSRIYFTSVFCGVWLTCSAWRWDKGTLLLWSCCSCVWSLPAFCPTRTAATTHTKTTCTCALYVYLWVSAITNITGQEIGRRLSSQMQISPLWV